jgi:hypothetical protein
MTTHEHSIELAGVNLAGRNHVCAFFNTIDEEHRVLGSFYKDGLDRGKDLPHAADQILQDPTLGLYRAETMRWVFSTRRRLIIFAFISPVAL